MSYTNNIDNKLVCTFVCCAFGFIRNSMIIQRKHGGDSFYIFILLAMMRNEIIERNSETDSEVAQVI